MKFFSHFLLLPMLFIVVNSSAQKVIQMESTNGVYRIACSVNGAKMKMIFDTGASNVSLSETMANFLYDNDYISKEDILGTSKTLTADGSIHDNVVINIKDIEVSGLHLKNVQAVVISGQNAPLLLGQSAIQKLGSITIEGNRLIINDAVGNLSKAQIEKYGYLGLILFVGIPLPGTGAWTGSLVASILKLDIKKSFICILIGIILALIIMSIISYGVIGNIIR